MTSEYTPGIEDVREAWLSSEYEERDSTTSNDELRAEIDRFVRRVQEEAWEEGFVNGFIDRHVARPDENGDFGPTLPFPNPYL